MRYYDYRAHCKYFYFLETLNLSAEDEFNGLGIFCVGKLNIHQRMVMDQDLLTGVAIAWRSGEYLKGGFTPKQYL